MKHKARIANRLAFVVPLLIATALLAGWMGPCNPAPVTNALFSNYLPIQVGPIQAGSTSAGSTGTQIFLPNIPTVSITICAPGSTTNCQTVDNIEVDTGSVGLRIFSQVLTTVSLPAASSGGSPIGECYPLAISSWGPVDMADVTMGSEPAVHVPIQVIEASFGTSAPPAPCNGSLMTPANFSANGILGIAPGSYGQYDSPPGGAFHYYTCQNGTCTAFSVSQKQMVQNPVYLLPEDNNGVLVYLTAVPDQGASQGSGALVLGVGTEPNNDPSYVSSGNPYSCVNASSQNFTTTYKGAVLPNSLFDTGTNALSFQDTYITQCNATILGPPFYCPSPADELSATVSDSTGNSYTVNFTVANAQSLEPVSYMPQQ